MSGDGGVRRVLMTADAVGGVWTYVTDLATTLGRGGVRVTVAVMGPPPREPQRRQASALGIDLVEAPYRLEWMEDPWADVELAGDWLLNLASRIEADLVHLNGFCHAALPWPIPTVVVAHSCVRTWWRGVHGVDAPASWDAYTERVTAGLRRASVVVAPTRALLDQVCSEYGVDGPCTVIPNGSSAVEGPCTPAAKDPLVFSAGRLWDEAKNMAALSAAAPHLSWPVCLAGDTDVASQPVVPSGAVRYLGSLSPEAMRTWYERAAIYALPARYEPFGLSILEAAAAGCALVLGDIRTLRENWSGAAVFVPPDNWRALGSAIQSLIDDPERRRALGERARDRASVFTVGRMADAYLALYRSVRAQAAAA